VSTTSQTFHLTLPTAPKTPFFVPFLSPDFCYYCLHLCLCVPKHRERKMAMNQSKAVVLRVSLVVVALCIAGYIVGPPLYWHFVEGLAGVSHSSPSACAPCVCDCSSQPILSIPQGLSLFSFRSGFLNCSITRFEILLKKSSFLNWVGSG